MPDRKSLVSTLWLASSLTLLASVLVAPILTSGFATASSWPDCLGLGFTLSSDQPTYQFTAGLGSEASREVNALPAENEEQDRVDALDEPRVAFPTLFSFRKVPDRHLIVSRLILPLYPLRC